MFKTGLNSETAFELLLKKADRWSQQTLGRVDFHRAVKAVGLRFNAPQIDSLFVALDLNEDGQLDLEEWKSRIYEDTTNPLQALREVITNNRLTSDDILFKMGLRIWDEPLDYPKL